MKKRRGLPGLVCFALALVFTACQNGTQEIEGDVGIRYKALNAPTLAGAGLVESSNPNNPIANIDGWPQSAPRYLYFNWKAGSGFEAGLDNFEVFVQLKDTNVISKLYDIPGSTNGKRYDYSTDTEDPNSLEIYSYTKQIDFYEITTSPDKLGSLGPSLVFATGVRFGIRAVPGYDYGGYRVPSEITWTAYYPN
jgi:hypothetical protein